MNGPKFCRAIAEGCTAQAQQAIKSAEGPSGINVAELTAAAVLARLSNAFLHAEELLEADELARLTRYGRQPPGLVDSLPLEAQ